MNNLIKAELYRITRGKSALSWVIAFLLVALLIITTFAPAAGEKISFQLICSGFIVNGVILSIYPGGKIGGHYGNRTAYYEIMDGSNVHKLIWTRFIVYIPLMTLIYYVPVSIVLLISDHSGESIVAVVMLLIIYVRNIVFVICVTMTIKTHSGAALPYFRLMIENIIAVMGLNSNTDASIEMTQNIIAVFGWFPCTECTLMANGLMDSTLIVKIVLGFIIEAVLMYMLAYTSYKKKWCIKTTLDTGI